MDYQDLASRLGLTALNYEMQRALETLKTPELILLEQMRTRSDLLGLAGDAKMAAHINGITDVAARAREQWSTIEASAFHAMEMVDSRTAVEAAKAQMGLDHLGALRTNPALDELVAASRRPFEGFEHLVLEATAARERLEAKVGRPLLDVSRVLESLRQAPTIIGAFDIPDLRMRRPPESEYVEADDSGNIDLPDEAHDRLVLVEFLPIRVMNEIRRRPEAMRQLTPRQFEEMTAELLNGLGFESIMLTPRSRDGGRDVIAVNRVQGIPILFAFECKRYAKRHVQLQTLRALLGTVMHPGTAASMGVLVTTSRFTSGASQFILSEARIDGKDFDGLVEWLRRYRRR